MDGIPSTLQAVAGMLSTEDNCSALDFGADTPLLPHIHPDSS
jgi:hypothetical protein